MNSFLSSVLWGRVLGGFALMFVGTFLVCMGTRLDPAAPTFAAVWTPVLSSFVDALKVACAFTGGMIIKAHKYNDEGEDAPKTTTPAPPAEAQAPDPEATTPQGNPVSPNP